MNNGKNTIDFFLGSNSPEGFRGFFEELVDIKSGHHGYIIKGTSGNGKSGIMRKVMDKIGESESRCELIHCSSDPDSLDGVIFSDTKTFLVDGTAPHVVVSKHNFCFKINLCLSTTP